MAIQTLSFALTTAPSALKIVQYDDVTHLITLFSETDLSPFTASNQVDPFDVLYEHIDAGVLYQVVAIQLTPFANLQTSNVCNIQVNPIVQDDTGGSTGQITALVSFTTGATTFQLVSGPNTPIGPQGTGVFTGLDAGTYTLRVTDTVCSKDSVITVPDASPLAGSFVKTDASAAGATDGSIDVTPSGGSGLYSYSWLDGPTTEDRNLLAAASYQITITDTVSLDTVVLTITINEPVAPVANPFFEVPILNSLRFVEEVPIDNCTTFRTPDNTLYNKESNIGFKSQPCFYQKYNTCDLITVQWQSTFENNFLEVRNYRDDSIITTISGDLKVQNTGQLSTFSGFIRDEGGTQIGIYFDSGAFPRPFQAGDTLELTGTTDYNGFYNIVGISYNSTLGQPYLVVNDTYVSDENASINVFFSSLPYDVYEAQIPLNAYPSGSLLYVRVHAQDTNFSNRFSDSEPIDLRIQHEGTHYLEWNNNDNAFNMAYSTGYKGFMRIDSRFYKVLPAGETEIYRDCDETPKIISATALRARLFEVFQQPWYIHEKLMFIFRHDVVNINGRQYVSEEGYEQPQFIELYPLSNSNVALIEAGLFNRPNLSDLGSVTPPVGNVSALDQEEGAILI